MSYRSVPDELAALKSSLQSEIGRWHINVGSMFSAGLGYGVALGGLAYFRGMQAKAKGNFDPLGIVIAGLIWLALVANAGIRRKAPSGSQSLIGGFAAFLFSNRTDLPAAGRLPVPAGQGEKLLLQEVKLKTATELSSRWRAVVTNRRVLIWDKKDPGIRIEIPVEELKEDTISEVKAGIGMDDDEVDFSLKVPAGSVNLADPYDLCHGLHRFWARTRVFNEMCDAVSDVMVRKPPEQAEDADLQPENSRDDQDPQLDPVEKSEPKDRAVRSQRDEESGFADQQSPNASGAQEERVRVAGARLVGHHKVVRRDNGWLCERCQMEDSRIGAFLNSRCEPRA